MMDTRTMLFTVLAAASKRNEKARDLIQQGYDRFASAFADKDMGPIEDLLTQGFQWKSTDGTVLDRAGTLAAIEQQMADIEHVCDMSIRIEQLQVTGNRADVHIREHLSAVMFDDSGVRVHILVEETYHDAWVKTSLGWKFDSTELLTSATETQPAESVPLRKAA